MKYLINKTSKISIIGIIAFIVLIISSGNIYSHNKIIKGTIVLKNGKSEPVVGATVKLEGTVLGAITNKDGKFVIKRIPDGKYILIVTKIGMVNLRKDIELLHIEGDELELNLEMEESSINMMPIVITATRSDKIYEDVPLKVSTSTEKDFRISSSNNIRECLQFQPGVRTEVNCQNCGFSQVRINGLEGKYSQILIDSKALFSALNGVYGLDQIPTNIIDRIEIVRGGASSLYGGNAIAGVINIITKDPTYNYFDVKLSNMLIDNKYPENVVNINGSIIDDNQSIGLSIFGMINNRHEYDANYDSFTEIGRMDIKLIGTKLFWKPNSYSKFSTELHSIHHEIRGGNKLDFAPHQSDITETAKNETMLAQCSYEQYIGDGNKLNIYLSGQQSNRNSYYGANKDINAYGTTQNRSFAAGINYNHILKNFLGEHIFLLGYDFNSDYINDIAVAYNRIIEQEVYTNGIFLQDDWSISENIDLLFGARFDKHNLINHLIINPRLSVLYKPLENASLRFSFSSGYRAPQAFDEDLHITQVSGEGMVIFLDPNLKPEISKSLSGSLDYLLNIFNIPISMSLEYFYTNLLDVFILEDNGVDSSGNRLMKRTNSNGATFQGITFEAQSNIFNNISIKLGMTYQKSVFSKEVEWSEGDKEHGIDPQFSDKVFKTPDFYGYFLINAAIFQDLVLNISANYTGPMYIPHFKGYIDRDMLIKTKSFFDVNTKLSYTIKSIPNIEFGLGVLNIFNSYQDDFDKGIDRDAGYIYGPFRPRTLLFSIKLSN